MKKTMLLLISAFLVLSTNAQTKKESISTFKIKNPYLTAEHIRLIDLETNDSIYYVSIMFQNRKYTQITDIQAIYFSKKDDFELFKKDIKTAIPEIESKQKISWNRDGLYSFYISDLFKELWVYDKDNLGYTVLNKKNAIAFLAWLETIQFGVQ